MRRKDGAIGLNIIIGKHSLMGFEGRGVLVSNEEDNRADQPGKRVQGKERRK